MALTLIDLNASFGLEDSAAMQVDVAFADIEDILTFPTLPSIASPTTNAEVIDLGAGEIVFKSGKCFKRFRSSLEQNSLTSELVGPRTAKSYMNKLSIARNQVNKETIGFIRSNRNRQLVVAVKPLNGSHYYILGWEGLPAEVDAGGHSIAAEISGDTKSNLEIVSLYWPLFTIDNISFTPAV